VVAVVVVAVVVWSECERVRAQGRLLLECRSLFQATFGAMRWVRQLYSLGIDGFDAPDR
jgi:hypothetical protein